MSIFAKHNKVLYVERILHFRPTLVQFRQGELGLADIGYPSLRQVANNLFVFRYPVWAPISGRFPLELVTKTIRHRSILRAIRKLEMTDPIMWLARPNMIELLDELPRPKLLIYHIVDEYSAYGGQFSEERERTKTLEQRMLDRADMAVVVSQKLYQAKHSFNPHTYLVANGVNYQAYADALALPNIPAQLQTIPQPRLGYSGLIGDRLDIGLLKKLAEAYPAWSFVFLGEVNIVHQINAWQAMLALPNVFYLGKVDAAQVPAYLKGFDVGLMPYAQSKEADNISPLKLYDYLAAGLPVASIAIPAAQEFSDYIQVADAPDLFAVAIENALTERSSEHASVRREVAKAHTWEARVEQLSDLIEARLGDAPL